MSISVFQMSDGKRIHLLLWFPLARRILDNMSAAFGAHADGEGCNILLCYSHAKHTFDNVSDFLSHASGERYN